MTDITELYHPDVVEAFASAWASIDGKSAQFEAERRGDRGPGDPDYTGHFEGYMAEANELLQRASTRLEGKMSLWDRLTPDLGKASDLNRDEMLIVVMDLTAILLTRMRRPEAFSDDVILDYLRRKGLTSPLRRVK